MMDPVELTFESQLAASPDETWTWVASMANLSREMWPYFRVTTPEAFDRIDQTITLGRPLFRGTLLLFGLLPVDRLDLTLVDIREGERYVEQSTLRLMKRWRHERILSPREGGCLVTDHVTFEPRWARPVVVWFIRKSFQHRHRVLRQHLDAAT